MSLGQIPWNKGKIKKDIIFCEYCRIKFNRLYDIDRKYCSRKCSNSDPVKNNKISKALKILKYKKLKL